MKFNSTFVVLLVVLFGFSIGPTRPVEAACDCGAISLLPSSGKPGTMVMLTITDTSTFPPGNYEVLWCKTPAFGTTDTQILATGTIAAENDGFTTSFTIPEAPFGIHFIRFSPQKSSGIVTFQFQVRPGIKVLVCLFRFLGRDRHYYY